MTYFRYINSDELIQETDEIFFFFRWTPIPEYEKKRNTKIIGKPAGTYSSVLRRELTVEECQQIISDTKAHHLSTNGGVLESPEQVWTKVKTSLDSMTPNECLATLVSAGIINESGDISEAYKNVIFDK